MGSHAVLGASARWFVPIGAVFAIVLLTSGAPGDGAGMRAGLAFSVAMAAHALVFGVAAAKSALPSLAARWLLALGATAVWLAATSPDHRMSGQIMEAGMFAAVVAAAALVLTILIGRAPTLRDEE